jgi:hypothetical protein
VAEAKKLIRVLGEHARGAVGRAVSVLLALLLGVGASGVVDLRLFLLYRLPAEQTLQHGLEEGAGRLHSQTLDGLLEGITCWKEIINRSET